MIQISDIDKKTIEKISAIAIKAGGKIIYSEENLSENKNIKAFKKRMKDNWINNIEPSYSNAK